MPVDAPQTAAFDPDRFETWIFDLDNTLYPPEIDLFAQIDLKMKAFIARTLDMPVDEAFRIQKDYFHRYGTSLRGLMEEHNVEPEAFLEDVHDIDHGVLIPDPRLDALLHRLPGRKLIYTNGSMGHAERVLESLLLSHHFDGIQHIASADYIPKPQEESYQALLKDHGVDPRRAIFFEDMHKNLKPAKEMGMATVWIRNTVHWSTDEEASLTPAYCDFITDDLVAWLDANVMAAPASSP
ncbi:MAG: pyrimidine 5'-nucleotidase [Rhodospirillaceae bacterium]